MTVRPVKFLPPAVFNRLTNRKSNQQGLASVVRTVCTVNDSDRTAEMHTIAERLEKWWMLVTALRPTSYNQLQYLLEATVLGIKYDKLSENSLSGYSSLTRCDQRRHKKYFTADPEGVLQITDTTWQEIKKSFADKAKELEPHLNQLLFYPGITCDRNAA